MKNILMEQGETQVEPFTSLMQLKEDFGHRNVVHAFTKLLAVEVEEDRCCVTCQRKAMWWHGRLSALLEEYEEQFPEPQAVTKVNHPGLIGIVQ